MRQRRIYNPLVLASEAKWPRLDDYAGTFCDCVVLLARLRLPLLFLETTTIQIVIPDGLYVQRPRHRRRDRLWVPSVQPRLLQSGQRVKVRATTLQWV